MFRATIAATARCMRPRPVAVCAAGRSVMTVAQVAASVPQLGSFCLPSIENEPMLNYAPGSSERMQLQAALADLRAPTEHEWPIRYSRCCQRSGDQNQKPFDPKLSF
ncbi:hypothetical protein BASA60_003559 [Batrachochytrium salamandrivorans]|nr:hypothetical protein BASA60_003559 [Batrachochytrium salamandrivorans]